MSNQSAVKPIIIKYNPTCKGEGVFEVKVPGTFNPILVTLKQGVTRIKAGMQGIAADNSLVEFVRVNDDLGIIVHNLLILKN